MKKIINGKKYDTETATPVASFSNSGGWRDFAHYEETLYRKKTGEFFLYGEGGPMTKYARSTGLNSWSGGDGFEPLTEDEAKLWLERFSDTETYEAQFGAVEE